MPDTQDAIHEWLMERSKEAQSLFPGHRHLFVMLEDGDPDGGSLQALERTIVSNMDEETLKAIGDDLIDERGKETQKISSHKLS